MTAPDSKPTTGTIRSPIISLVYNEPTKSLTVTFDHGKVYRYDGVPLHMVEAMRRAEHKAAFLVKHIKGHYKATLVSTGVVL